MSDIAIPEVPYAIQDDVRDIVEKQLSARNETGGQKDRFMFHFESRAIYRWQSEASVEGYRFLSDEGPHQGGTSIGPAPLRYFVGGLVIAIQIWVIKMAAFSNIQIRSLRSAADTYRESGTDEEFPNGRGFSRIVLTVDLKSDWQGDGATISKMVADAVEACPAAVTINRALDLVVHVVHNGVAIDSA